MSQIFNGSTGGGLTSVATDATLTGDGTVGDPLSVVDTGGTYSVAKTVFNNGALPPYVVPATVYPDTAAWFAVEISSTDADFNAGVIRFINAGTYRITMQMSFEKLPDPAIQMLQVQFGLTDAPFNPSLYETYEACDFAPNETGILSPTFTTVIEAGAGQTLAPFFILSGTAGANVQLVVGAQAGNIIVERVV